jgi:hypothetical protein
VRRGKAHASRFWRRSSDRVADRLQDGALRVVLGACGRRVEAYRFGSLGCHVEDGAFTISIQEQQRGLANRSCGLAVKISIKA